MAGSSSRVVAGRAVACRIGPGEGDVVLAEGGARTWLVAFGRAALLVSTLALPAGIATALVDDWIGTAVLLGAAATLVGAMGAGTGAARAAVPVLVVGPALGTMVLGSAWWVVLVTALAGLAGLASARGAMPAFSMAALAVVVAPGPATPRAAAAYAIGLGVGAAYRLLIAGRMNIVGPRVDVELPPVVVAAVLAGTTGLAAAIAQVLGDPRADWIPLTVLAVAGTAVRGLQRRALDRAAGTLLGVGVAVALAESGLASGMLVGLGAVAMVGSLAAVGTSYRWTSLLVTLAVVLVAGPDATVPDIAVRRLGYTVAGAVVLVAGVVAGRIVLPHLPRPHEDLPTPP